MPMYLSMHFSAYDRRQHDAGRCWYLPVNLGEIPDYYRRFNPPIDIAIIRTRPMDENGYFNSSLANLWIRAVVERARMVIVEVTESLPHVDGPTNAIHASEVDYRDRGRQRPAAGASQHRAQRGGPRRGPADRRRDGGRRLPADRHRRHAQCRVQRIAGERAEGPGRPDRDADGRHRRPLPLRPDHQCAQDSSIPASPSSPSGSAARRSTTRCTATRIS